MENFNHNNEKFSIEEISAHQGAKIKVIGVGGAGTNMVNRIAQEKDILPVTLIAANTDAQHLQNSLADVKVQLGEELTKGLGAGMNPQIGKDSALESEEKIKEVLSDADIIFVAAGLGGGTGTGAASVIAKIAKELGSLTISIVTTPFTFEGKKREKLAQTGLAQIEEESNSIVVIPNAKLSSIIDRTTGYANAFKVIDDILFRAVNGICGVIMKQGFGDINVDFADLKTIMSHKGTALMGIAEGNGDKSAIDVLKNAIESPMLENVNLKDLNGVLIHFHFHPDYPLLEIEEAMGYINTNIEEELADVIFGTTPDESVEPSNIKITIIATGFSKSSKGKPPAPSPSAQKTPPKSAPKEAPKNRQETTPPALQEEVQENLQENVVEKKSEKPYTPPTKTLDDILKNKEIRAASDSNDLESPSFLRKYSKNK